MAETFKVGANARELLRYTQRATRIVTDDISRSDARKIIQKVAALEDVRDIQKVCGTAVHALDTLHGGRYHQCEESRYLDKEGHGRKIPGDEVAHVGTRTCRKTPGRSGTETADRTGCRPESRPLPGTVNAQRATALHKGCGLFV